MFDRKLQWDVHIKLNETLQTKLCKMIFICFHFSECAIKLFYGIIVRRGAFIYVFRPFVFSKKKNIGLGQNKFNSTSLLLNSKRVKHVLNLRKVS